MRTSVCAQDSDSKREWEGSVSISVEEKLRQRTLRNEKWEKDRKQKEAEMWLSGNNKDRNQRGKGTEHVCVCKYEIVCTRGVKGRNLASSLPN